MKEFMMIPQGFHGLPMDEEFLTNAQNKKNYVNSGAGLELWPRDANQRSRREQGVLYWLGRGDAMR
jgi:hypothetical protein